MSTRQKKPDVAAATTVQMNSSMASGEQDLVFHRTGRERPGQDAPPRRQYEETDDLINVADNSNHDELEDAKGDCRGPTDARH